MDQQRLVRVFRCSAFLSVAAVAAILTMGAEVFAEPPAGRADSGISAQAASDGYRTATRLGGPRRFNPPLRDLAAVKRMASRARTQKDLSTAIDKAGLTALTAEILRILQAADPSEMRDMTFPIGSTMEWMALRNGGRPDIIRNIRWGGRQPFPAWEFTIDDGTKLYTFVLPKECANLALVKTGTSPKAEEAARRAAEEQAAQRRRAEEEAARKRAEEEAARKRQAEEQARQAELRRTPGCGITTTRTYAKGLYTIEIDGSGSASGPVPAVRIRVSAIGVDGQPLTVTHEGQSVTEVTLTPPFRTTVTARKLKPGTYTLRVVSTRDNKVAPDSTCEATFVIEQMDNMDVFADGTFGKQRRQYDLVNQDGFDVSPGFCDPQLAVKGGPLFWFAEGKASFAPALGLAFQFGGLDDFDFDPNEYNNVSLLAEAVVNYHFAPRGAFIGTGFGWWDIFDTDHNTGSWLVNFGVPVKDTDTSSVLFIGEGRLFFADNDQSSNYNLAAGIRVIYK